MKSFQTILLFIFAFFIVGSVLIFSGVIGGGNRTQDRLIQDPVILWGTLPSIVVEDILRAAVEVGDKFDVTYVQKSSEDFEADFIDALAAGEGPDLVLVPHTLVIKQQGKLLPLPESAIDERLFRDSFVEAAEVLLEQTYTKALPLFLDPIVMYWNRDMFTRADIVVAPSTWVEVQLLPERLTVLDNRGNISEAAVALGGVNNVNHFKDILAALIMQTGNPIVRRDLEAKEGSTLIMPRVTLNEAGGADAALRFYSEFANPSLSKYSWNSAKRNSLDEFTGGKLGVYFGKASELATIRGRNPHLNFDVALLPQLTDAQIRVTYADIYSLAVVKNSPSTQSAFAVAYRMVLGETARIVSDALKLPPARRDLLALAPPDLFLASFYKSAVISRTWYDPNSTVTRNIFADMVESVMIGRLNPSASVSAADSRLRDLFVGEI